MSRVIFLCFFIAVLAHNACMAQHIQGEAQKNSPSKPMLHHGRFRRGGGESDTTTANGKSNEEEEKDDKNSSEAHRMKREEDDDTPMHEGEELDEEGDKSDVGLDAKNETETTMEASNAEGSTPEHTDEEEATNGQQSNETARKKRDENPTDENIQSADESEMADHKHVGESCNQTAAEEDGVRNRNRRASATNSKAKMAVKSTKTASGGGQRGPRGLETEEDNAKNE